MQFNYSVQITPLHAASENGYLDVVEFLIKKGAEVNAEDESQVKFILEKR